MHYTPTKVELYRFKEGLCYFCGTNQHIGNVHLLPNQTLDGELFELEPPDESDIIFKCYDCQKKQVLDAHDVHIMMDTPHQQILTCDPLGLQWEWRLR